LGLATPQAVFGYQIASVDTLICLYEFYDSCVFPLAC
jgi:hypothetical protein